MKESGKAAFLHAFTGSKNRMATKMQAEACAPPAKNTASEKCLYAQMGTAWAIHMQHIWQQSIALRNMQPTSLK